MSLRLAVSSVQRVSTAQKTAVFQLHNLSKHKRALVLDSMKRTHRCYGAIVDALLVRLPEIEAIEKKTERNSFMQSAIAYPTLKKWTLCPSTKAAARVDAIGAVESFIQQKKERPVASPPTLDPLAPHVERRNQILDEFISLGSDLPRENELRDELSRVSKVPHPRPLGLYGYKEFYRLLRHAESDRLYAWIYLLEKGNRYAPDRKELSGRLGVMDAQKMVDVATGELIRCDRPGWILFPLAFGHDFHERRYLEAGKPKGARLVHKPEEDRFELHVMFEYETPLLETSNWLGVDRGIYNLAAWCVVNTSGTPIASSTIEGRTLKYIQQRFLRQRRESQQKGKIVRGRLMGAYGDEAVHKTANELVALAVQHKARLVLEDLHMRRVTKRPRFAPRSSFNAILNRHQYQKLRDALEYKVAVAGLPPPLYVGAAFTSQTCLECGHVCRENRVKTSVEGGEFKMDRFRCVQCSHEADADINAARVIGLKGAWLSQLPTKAQRSGRVLQEAEQFPQYVIDAARRRGSSGEVARPSPVPL